MNEEMKKKYQYLLLLSHRVTQHTASIFMIAENRENDSLLLYKLDISPHSNIVVRSIKLYTFLLYIYSLLSTDIMLSNAAHTRSLL